MSVPPDGGSPPVGEPRGAPSFLTDAVGDADVHAFLIADVRGWTTFTQERGDEEAARLAGRFAEVTRTVVETHRGHVVELRGDEALVVFGSPRSAIRGAVALQQRFVEETIDDPSLPLTVGIGLDAGEAVPVEGGYRGGALNVAARLCSLARAGEVLASREIVHLARRVAGVRFTERGMAELKGLEKPVHVVAVRSEERDDARTIAPYVRSPAPPRAPWWRRKTAIGVVAFAVLAAVIAVPFFARTAGGSSEIEPDSLGILDPDSGEVTATVELGSRPGAVAASADAVWVTHPDVGTVTRIDPNEQEIRDSIQVGESPTEIAAGFDAVWVVESGGPSVSRISAETNEVVETIPVGSGPADLAVGEGSVWVTNRFDGTIQRIDPNVGEVVDTIPVGLDPRGIAVGFGSVWVSLAGSNTVVRIDPVSSDVTQPIGVGNAPSAMAIGADGVWVVNALDDTVSRIDPDTNSVAGTVAVGDGPSGISTLSGTVWVANEADGTLSRIEPGQTSPEETVIGSAPQGLAGVNGELWVSVHGTATSHRGGTLRVVSRGFGESLDPAAAYGPHAWRLSHLLGDGLVAFEPIGGISSGVVPDLALSIPAPTDNGRTYVFELRQGIRYSTGQVVAPSDFVRAFERGFGIVPPGAENASLYPGFFGGLLGGEACANEPATCDLSEGIEADDEGGTIAFHLVASDPEFLDKLALSVAYPVPPSTPDEQQPHDGVPGTGPYMLESPMTDEGVILIRNPHFNTWSSAAQPDGYVDRIEWSFGVEPQEQVEAVRAGEADIGIDTFLTSGLDDLFARFPAQVHTNPAPVIYFIVLNTQEPPFDRVEVRRALNLAIDRERVVQIFGGAEAMLATCQQIPPNFPGYQPYCPYTSNPGPDGEGSWTEPDLDRAERIVSRSGTAGMRVVYEYDRDNWPLAPALGDYLIELLEDLGYRASVRPASEDEVYDPANEFQMATQGWGSDYPAASAMFNFQHTCGASLTPLSGFCDPRIDAMIDRAILLRSADPAAADRLWSEIDREIVDQAPYVWLVNPIAVDFVSERVGNFQWNTQWGTLFNQFWVR
jgi:peptide/nickel transport system substrate-binding protein